MIVLLGVTATRRGMHPRQKERAFSLLHHLKDLIEEARHGDCKGGDAEFHDMFMTLGFRTIIHPPTEERYRAFCEGAYRVEEPDEYLKRDRAIVRASNLIISAPWTETPLPRSGTWYTDRYARRRRVGRDLIRVLPNGDVYPIRQTMSLLSPFMTHLEDGGFGA